MVCTLFDRETYMELHDRNLRKESEAVGQARGEAIGQARGQNKMIEAIKRVGIDPEMVLQYAETD